MGAIQHLVMQKPFKWSGGGRGTWKVLHKTKGSYHSDNAQTWFFNFRTFLPVVSAVVTTTGGLWAACKIWLITLRQ
jgi:hypothetical protein